MLRFVLRRLVQLVPVLVGLSLLLFIWVRALPGDPARALLGEKASVGTGLAIGTPGRKSMTSSLMSL